EPHRRNVTDGGQDHRKCHHDAPEIGLAIAHGLERGVLWQLTCDLRGQRLIEDHEPDGDCNDSAKSEYQAGRGARHPVSGLAIGKFGAGKYLSISGENFTEDRGDVLGIGASVKSDQTETDIAQALLREHAHEIEVTRDRDPKSHESGAKLVGPADRDVAMLD